MAFELALAVAAAQADASAATIALNAEHHGDAIYIGASTLLNADAVTAWLVLTDYNRYSEFIPDLRVSRIVARRGATGTVEQSGDGALWLFKLPLDITFEIIELPPYGLQSRAVAGSLRALSSSYTLTPVGAAEQVAVRQSITRQFRRTTPVLPGLRKGLS